MRGNLNSQDLLTALNDLAEFIIQDRRMWSEILRDLYGGYLEMLENDTLLLANILDPGEEYLNAW